MSYNQEKTIDVRGLKAAVSNTKTKVTSLDDRTKPLTYHNAGAHNSIYRNKDLGGVITAEQSATIRAGTFKDIYPGDYWQSTIPAYTWTDWEGVEHEVPAGNYQYYWRVLGCNSYTLAINNLYPKTPNHVVVYPESSLYTLAMNETDTTAGGYVGSDMFTKHLRRAEAIIKAVFGEEHILPHYDYLCNAVTDGVETGNAFFEDRIVDLMSENMVFGRRIYSKNSYENERDDFQQPYFKFQRIVVMGSHAWLRDVCSGSQFAAINAFGGAVKVPASNSAICNVKPFFLLY